MRLGYFTMPVHPASRNPTDTLREDREIIMRNKCAAVRIVGAGDKSVA